ncbi:hypothetical protein OZD61_00785 [Wolbachia endosymbiont of Drosophila bocki]|nr:hypothetical protein [Wolbachia endosymbiont of Drosophila bocki]
MSFPSFLSYYEDFKQVLSHFSYKELRSFCWLIIVKPTGLSINKIKELQD